MTDSVQYEIAELGDTAATVRVAVPQADVLREIEAVYAQYGNELSIPGFRKGRVPKHVLETRFGKEVFALEAKEALERKHVPAALRHLDLHPVSTPKLEEVSEGPETGLVFSVSFSILPKIELASHQGLEVTVPRGPAVSDDDVELALAEIQRQFGVLAPREGEIVAESDIVHVRERDEEWDTRAEKESPITGPLVGSKVGDHVEIEVPGEEGKKIRTTLEVLGLRQVVLPTIDDELAKDAGFDSLATLRDDVRRRLGASRDDRHRRAVESALVDALVEKTSFPLPEPFVLELVDEEVDRIRKVFEHPESRLGFDDYLKERATSEEDMRKELRGSVERRLRRELVLGRLAEVENVSIGEAELEELAHNEAAKTAEDGMRFVAQLKAEERWDDYRSAKVTERLLGILRGSAVINEEG